MVDSIRGIDLFIIPDSLLGRYNINMDTGEFKIQALKFLLIIFYYALIVLLCVIWIEKILCNLGLHVLIDCKV